MLLLLLDCFVGHHQGMRQRPFLLAKFHKSTLIILLLLFLLLVLIVFSGHYRGKRRRLFISLSIFSLGRVTHHSFLSERFLPLLVE